VGERIGAIPRGRNGSATRDGRAGPLRPAAARRWTPGSRTASAEGGLVPASDHRRPRRACGSPSAPPRLSA